jgi:glutaconate CoA-transferase subunit A
MYVTGVVDAPMGAHFTECPPDYERDEGFQREYAATARDEEAWKTFKASYLDLDSHAEYVKAINARGQK